MPSGSKALAPVGLCSSWTFKPDILPSLVSVVVAIWEPSLLISSNWSPVWKRLAKAEGLPVQAGAAGASTSKVELVSVATQLAPPGSGWEGGVAGSAVMTVMESKQVAE